VTSGDPDSANPEVVVHVSEETYCVDAATGAPLDMEKVKDGDTLYVWAGPAMTMSLPPQTTAAVIVGNVPADGKIPQYESSPGRGKPPRPPCVLRMRKSASLPSQAAS